MKKILKTAIAVLCAAVMTTGCQKSGKFHVTGQITEAKDTMLYLEHLTLTQGAVAVDSVKLDEDGEFSLQGDTIPNPEFYRLRIGNQIINLSIDSTETVTVKASLPKMTLGYTVEGSGNCDTIRMISLRLHDLHKQLRATADNRDLTLEERDIAMANLVQDYKTEMKVTFMQNRYDKASSYFALFQMLNGLMLFDPVNDPSDVTWFHAVANAWNEKWPGTTRTENLCNIALQGKRNTRRRTVELNIDGDKVKETGIIDMHFPDIRGNERTLSSLEGQVVLLDFTAFGMKGSSERTLALRTLYNKYHSRGLEIYQVSLDPDRHYWQTMVDQLPWISVWNGNPDTNDILTLYNVQQIPTWFLIDRGSNLVGRMEMIPSIEQAIEELL